MIQEWVWFIQANWDLLMATILAFVTFAELAVRLTPTKTDDGAVERIGGMIRKLLDVMKVPNKAKYNPDANEEDDK